ncbi:MAG: leucyl aminopeptidase, partial [Thermomicrobiaceae bacterium]|nr:leucyl aminopeptidase [Thermomicrobiaceae bacterium]
PEPEARVDLLLDGELAHTLAESGFTGEVGKTLVIPTLGRLRARRLVATGIGAEGERTAEALQRAYGVAARAARDAGARSVALALPPAPGLSAETTARAVVEGISLATYRFVEYQTREQGKALESVALLAEGDEVARGMALGERVGRGVCLARDLGNQPPNVLYPARLAEIAREVAQEHGLECRVYDRAALEEMGARCILAVGQGSAREPRLIHLIYRPEGTPRGAVGLVGKAITFDTGGINLKPTGSIETMKIDMAGGAAVLGAMSVVPALGLPFVVHGVIASAENMPSGTAFRPSDVLRALNGKTIEIVSTDAEGRLVLADALTYTAREGAEAMIDLATLTGAC